MGKRNIESHLFQVLVSLYNSLSGPSSENGTEVFWARVSWCYLQNKLEFLIGVCMCVIYTGKSDGDPLGPEGGTRSDLNHNIKGFRATPLDLHLLLWIYPVVNGEYWKVRFWSRNTLSWQGQDFFLMKQKLPRARKWVDSPEKSSLHEVILSLRKEC